MADFLLSVGVDVGLSYEQMKKDISNLVSDLNKTPPKIKVAFDIDQKAVESLRNQITAISKQLGSTSTNTSSDSTHQKATAEIADIANEARRAANTQAAASKKAANAEKEHETSLRQVLNTYRELLAAMRTNQNAQVASTYSELVKQADLFGNALEIAEDKAISIDAALKQVGLDGSTAIENAKTALAAFRVEMEQTGSSGTINMSQMYSVIAQMQNLLSSNANAANLSSYAVLQEQVRLFTDALQLASSGSISLSEALKQVGLDGSTAIGGARTAMAAFRAEVAGATVEEVKLTKGSEQYNAALNKVNTLLAAVRSNTEKWTAAKNGNSSKDYQIYSQQADALEKLSRELQNGEMSAREFNKQFSEIKTTTVQSSAAIRAAGENTQTFSEKIGSLSSKFGTWFSITRVIMAAFRSVKQMVSAVIELDTAMTELKKVTDETDATYEKFLVNAASRAKQLGAALSDTVTATADFARLGFNIEEAEKLADTAIVYKNVGDGIKDISEASESIIATMQAFGIAADDAMTIVDKFNEVGNNYAISSEGVGEALLRSAAAMHAANNSLDETIALATAANTIVQDPEKVGTTLKTVSMYLRAAKTEAEEAGEATDGMATSVSELRKNILALTNNKVDIQIDEDTFKSTYQILKELSEVWGELTDLTQANILEMVGGKRNSNVVAALLDNFSVAEEALKTSADSAGSALKENEEVLESIQGRINIMKASFETLSNNVISSDLVKAFVDAGTGMLDLLNGIAKVIDALGGLKTILLTVASVLLIAKGGLIAYKVQLIAVAAVKKIITFFGSLKEGLLNILNIIPNAIVAWKAYAAGTVSASTAMQASIPVIGLVIAAITALVGALSLYNSGADEAKQKAKDASDASSELSDEISSLAYKYLELSNAVGTDKNIKDELLSTQDELIKKLSLEKSKIQELTGEYGSYTDAIKAATVAKLQEQERDIRGGLNEYKKDVINVADEGFFSTDSILISGGKTNGIFSSSDSVRQQQEELYKGLKALEKAGLISSGSYSSYEGDNGKKYSQGFSFFAGLYDDLSTVDGILNAYKELGNMLDIISSEIGSDNVLYEAVYEKYNELTESVGAYNDAIGNLNTNLAEQYALNGLVGKDIPTTEKGFEEYRNEVIKVAKASGEFIGSSEDIEVAIDNVLSQQSQFASFYEDIFTSQNQASDLVNNSLLSFKDFIAAVNELSNGLDELDKIYADIVDEGDFDWDSLFANKEFIDEFSSLGDVFDDFLETVTNSPTDIEACQEAFDKLTTAYILNSDKLSDVTDETRDATVAILEQNGIANAAAVVDAQLALNKARLKVASQEYSQATLEEIASEYSSANASEALKQALAELWLQKVNLNTYKIDSSGDIDQIIAMANAANAASASIAALQHAKSVLSAIENGTAAGFRMIDNGEYADALKTIEQINNGTFNYDFQGLKSSDFKIKVDYSGGKTTRDTYDSIAKDAAKAAEKAAKEEKSWFEIQLAEHEHLVAMEEESQRDYLDWLNSAYQQAYNENIITIDDFYKYQEEVYKGLRDLFEDYLNDVEHEISMRENYDGESKKIISMYKDLISAVENEIASARAHGLSDTDDYIQSLQDKWMSYRDSIKDIEDDITDNAKDAIEELVDYQKNIFKQDIENQKDAINKKLDYLKEFYDKQKEMLQDQYDEEEYLKEQSEKRKSVSDIQAQLAQLEFDDSAWAQKRKAELQKELADAQDELDSFEKQHALDAALDAIEESYNAQEEQLQKQIDALDEELNDPELMFNKALAAIQENTGNLYEQMLEYNRKYGSGNDDDVKDVYEEAYKALLEYRELYGKDYDGVSLSNKTGYTPNTSWNGASVSQPNTPSPPQQSSSPSTTATSSGNSSPELYEGATVTVKDSATNFSDRSHNAYMASFVPGGEFTAYQIRGDEVLIGRNGAYTGWINKSDIVGYASGTKNATPGIHRVDEVAPETIFQSKDGSRYKLFTGGEKVLNAKASNFLYDFANQGGSLLKDGIYNTILSAILSGLFDVVRSSICKNEINLGDIIVQGNADRQTVSEIRREQRSAVEYMLKELNKLNK